MPSSLFRPSIASRNALEALAYKPCGVDGVDGVADGDLAVTFGVNTLDAADVDDGDSSAPSARPARVNIISRHTLAPNCVVMASIFFRTGARLACAHTRIHRPRSSMTRCASSGPSSSSSGATEFETIGVVRRRLDALQNRVDAALHIVDVDALTIELTELDAKSAQQDLWDDPKRATKVMHALGVVKEELANARAFGTHVEDARTALELAGVGEGAAEMDAMMTEALASLDALDKALEAWELRRLLGGQYDAGGAVVQIYAGAGGLDAQDWSEMLERMYLGWCEKKGYSVRVTERLEGEGGGLKTCTLEVDGRYAYGYLHAEKGTHRLVRQSPFKKDATRQTSFAAVDVIPLFDDSVADTVTLPESDLEITTMRSSGPGGQNVNKLETAVRIKHLPTDITVKCDSHRTQAMNKQEALVRLKAKLTSLAEEARVADIAELRGDIVKAEWGQQIRNYVLHPYKLVKDVRTGVETSDVDKTLGGNLDDFMTGYLRWKAEEI